jgi:tricorn protease
VADTFSQLPDWEGNDGKPRWSGDDAVLFLSDRINSTQNIHRQALGEETAEAITDFEDIDVAGFDATSDGRKIVLHRWDSLFTIDLDDPNAVPRPMVITAPEDALDSEENLDISRRITEAALNPDGESIAVIAYGEIVIRGTADDAPSRRVTETHGREGDLAWSPDGTTLYFTTMQGGNASVMTATVARTREEIKKDYVDRTDSSEPESDAEADGEGEEAGEPTDDGENLDPADAADEGNERVVEAADEEKSEDESSAESAGEDGAEDEATSEDDGDPLLDPARWADAVSFEISPLIQTGTNDHRPSPSPDGMTLGFIRGLGDIMMFNLATGEETLLRAGWDRGIEFEWSLDSKWIVFDQADMNFNQDVFIVPSDGSAAPINISRHPDNDGGARFSADAKVLAFSSERDSEEYDVWYVFLDRALEKLAKPELEKYFEDAEKAAKKRKPLDPNKVRKALAKAAAAAVVDSESAPGPDAAMEVTDADADADADAGLLSPRLLDAPRGGSGFGLAGRSGARARPTSGPALAWCLARFASI